MRKDPIWKNRPGVPPGTLNIEPSPNDPVLHSSAKHANTFQISHTDADLYIWFGEGLPPFIAHDAADLPEDFKVVGKTVAFISMPIKNLYSLRYLAEEQLQVYKSRFGSFPKLTQWAQDRHDAFIEEEKIQVLKFMGWLPGYNDEGDIEEPPVEDIEPWKRANSHGEFPGDICCQRSGSEFCFEHNPLNYDLNKEGPVDDWEDENQTGEWKEDEWPDGRVTTQEQSDAVRRWRNEAP